MDEKNANMMTSEELNGEETRDNSTSRYMESISSGGRNDDNKLEINISETSRRG